MENYFNSQMNGAGGEMTITNQAREFLRETAKWAKFLAIMGFIGLIFMVMAGFMMGALMSTSFGDLMETPGLPRWFLPFFYIIFAAIYAAPLYYLYQFSNKAKIALEANDNNLLTEALGFLKSHYKYIGIMMIVIMAVYALIIIVAIIAAIAGVTAMSSL